MENTKYTSERDYGADTAARSVEIPREIESLQAQTEMNLKRLSDLAKRLTPVLQHESPATPMLDAEEKERGTNTPMSERIRIIRGTVQQSNSLISSLLERLEI